MQKKQVKEIWEKEMPKIEKAFVDFPWEDERAYSHYLAQTYRYISHSCELLKYAAQKTDNEGLKQCLIHHDEEEQGHENLALNDLKRMGYTLEDFPELDITSEVYNTIYKQIDEFGPAAIVGYALALEGVSARRCPEIAKRLVAKWGPMKSTLIKLHGEVDPGHIEESFDVLNFFSEDELDKVAMVVSESVSRYVEYLSQVSAKSLLAS